MIDSVRTPITCACCPDTFAEWRHGPTLVVLSKHHGDRHPNLVTVDMFIERMTPEQLDTLAHQIGRRLKRYDRIEV